MDIVELNLLHTSQDMKYYLFMLCRSCLYMLKYCTYTCILVIHCTHMSTYGLYNVTHIHVYINNVHEY